MSGKYRGTVKLFQIKPVVVFANSFPTITNLSQDRRNVQVIGQGLLSNLSRHAVVSLAEEFPFVEPISPPDLSEGFQLREYLEKNLEALNPPPETPVEEPEHQIGNNASQVSGNSFFQIPEPLASFETQSTQTPPISRSKSNRGRQIGIVISTPLTSSESSIDNQAPMHVVRCPLHSIQGILLHIMSE